MPKGHGKRRRADGVDKGKVRLEAVVQELEAAAEKLGVKVRYEKMTGLCAGRGGLCSVRGEFRLIVDRRTTPEQRLDHLVEALARFDLEGLYLSPLARRYVDEARSQGGGKLPEGPAGFVVAGWEDVGKKAEAALRPA